MTKRATYTADDGTAYTIIVTDFTDDIDNAHHGLDVVQDPAAPDLPKQVKVRGVYMKSEDNTKRRFVPCNTSGDFYNTFASNEVTLTGDNAGKWITTGRIGEKQTFTSYASITAAAGQAPAT